ncbi:MAG: hypothetical protein QOE46_915 [Acidobacteriota bacterium]|nr:hypothetical protein [Acidobacteriota bacterium]
MLRPRRLSVGEGRERVMLSLIQIALTALALGTLFVLMSETFALAVSRVMEAAFDRIEYALALRARTRAERLKSRRREERRRTLRTRGERFAAEAA